MNLLYALFALDILNLAVFLPVFSAFIRSIGGTPFTLGLINSSSAFVSLLWNPIVGSLSDQVGRKGLLIKCLLASALGSIIMAFSTSLPLVFVGKLIGALGSPVGILLRSIVADIYKSAEEKKTFFNKSAPFISIAFLVGSVSSGFLSEAKNGFTLAFLLMAFIMGVATLLAQTNLENDTKTDGARGNSDHALINRGLDKLNSALNDLKEISWPRYKTMFIIKASYDISVTVLTTNVGFIMLNEFNITGRYTGYVFLMFSVLSIVSNILKLKLKSLLERISEYDVLVKGGLLMTVSFIGMSASSNVSVFLLFFAVMCIAKAFLDTTFTELITTRTTDEDRGKVIGAYENLVPLAGFIVPVLSGLFAELFGERLLMFSSAFPMLLAAFLANTQKISTA